MEIFLEILVRVMKKSLNKRKLDHSFQKPGSTMKKLWGKSSKHLSQSLELSLVRIFILLETLIQCLFATLIYIVNRRNYSDNKPVFATACSETCDVF